MLAGGRCKHSYNHLSGKQFNRQYIIYTLSSQQNICPTLVPKPKVIPIPSPIPSPSTKVIPSQNLYPTVDNTLDDASTVGKFLHSLPAIRLKPEYEIYDKIFGKPNRAKRDIYQVEKIKDIEEWLHLPLEQIKTKMAKKYNII